MGRLMLKDRYGKNVEVGEWFIRLDQNDEGRVYRVEEYPEPGRIVVHEHTHEYKGVYSSGPIIGLKPKAKKQNIILPRTVIWYPESLFPPIIKPE